MNRALQPTATEAQIPERDEHPIPRGQKFLSTPSICERFGISRWTWHRWVVSGQAPAPVHNWPGHPRWAVSDIERFERGRFWMGR